VVICLGRGADLYMAQLMPLPLTISCFSKIQIGFYLSGTVSPGHTHTQPFYGPLGFCPGLPGVSWHQEGETNLDLLEQEIVSGSGISWAICKSAP